MTPGSQTQPAVERRGRDRAGACAAVWDDAPQAAWGTASRALFWVGLEQTGPWGRTAFTESRLDPNLGRALESGCADAGGRALLMRVVGPEREPATPDARFERPRRVFVAGGMTVGRPWLLAGHVSDPARVLDMPFDAAAAGDDHALLSAAPWLRPHPSPVALVCTNSKRDVCCAVRGRPAATRAATARPGRVWECSHTGGHRFAPTGVLLPHGITFARCSGDDVVTALDTAETGRLDARVADEQHLRGLAHLWPAEQAADAFVRRAHGVDDLTALRVEQLTGPPAAAQTPPAAEGAHVNREFAVRHADGRGWRVRVTVRALPQRLVTSCGAPAVPVTDVEVATLGPI